MVPSSPGEKASRAPAWGPNSVAAKNRAAGASSAAVVSKPVDAPVSNSASTLPREDIESLEALSEDERAVFRALHNQVADEARSGGPRTRYSILKTFGFMTNEQMELCIDLYTQHSERVAGEAAAAAVASAAAPTSAASAAPAAVVAAEATPAAAVAPQAQDAMWEERNKATEKSRLERAEQFAAAREKAAEAKKEQAAASATSAAGNAVVSSGPSPLPPKAASSAAAPREWPVRKQPPSASPAAPTPTPAASSAGAREWPVRKPPPSSAQPDAKATHAPPAGSGPPASAPPVPPGLDLPPGLPSSGDEAVASSDDIAVDDDAGADGGGSGGSSVAGAKAKLPALPPKPTGLAPPAPPSPPAPREGDDEVVGVAARSSPTTAATFEAMPPLPVDRDAAVDPPATPPVASPDGVTAQGKPGDAWVRKRIFQLRVQISPELLLTVLENLSVGQLVEPFTEVKMWLGLDENEPLPAALEQLVKEYRAACAGSSLPKAP